MSLVDQPLKISYPPTQAISPCSVTIGTCDDGLPFLFDLTNPACGSILVGGDPGSGKTNFLRSVLSSVVESNSAEQVCFAVITPKPEEYADLASSPHCTGIYCSRKPEVRTFLNELLSLADQRQYQRESRPILLVVIDNLADCIHGLDDESYWGLEWLVRLGPGLNIWVLASQSTACLKWLDGELIEAFPTHLLGRITSPADASFLTNGSVYQYPPLPKIAHGDRQGGVDPGEGCFYVPYEESWISISPNTLPDW